MNSASLKQRQIDDEKIFAYSNACAKIRLLMRDAVLRRKHKSLVSVADLNEALNAFGIDTKTIHEDLTQYAITTNTNETQQHS